MKACSVHKQWFLQSTAILEIYSILVKGHQVDSVNFSWSGLATIFFAKLSFDIFLVCAI